MADDIPRWVWAEVDRRAEYAGHPNTSFEWAGYTDRLRQLAAALIAEHEEPPVDPLVEPVSLALGRALLDAGKGKNWRWGQFGPHSAPGPSEPAHAVVSGFLKQLTERGLEIREVQP